MKGKQTYSATNQQLDPKTGYKTTITVKTEDPSVIRNLIGTNPTFRENKKPVQKKKPQETKIVVYNSTKKPGSNNTATTKKSNSAKKRTTKRSTSTKKSTPKRKK